MSKEASDRVDGLQSLECVNKGGADSPILLFKESMAAHTLTLLSFSVTIVPGIYLPGSNHCAISVKEHLFSLIH